MTPELKHEPPLCFKPVAGVASCRYVSAGGFAHIRFSAAGRDDAYGVRPKTIWMGEEAAKGYLKENFEDVFQRYIPKAQARLWLKELEATVVREKTENGVEQEAMKRAETNGDGARCPSDK